MSTFRTLAAVLATAALAAPAAATAQPTDLGVRAAQAQQPKQNLSSPDARDAAAHPRYFSHKPPASTLDVNPFTGQAAPVRPADPPVYVQPRGLAPVEEQSAASAGSTDRRPVTEAPPAIVSDSGDGIDWATIGLGVAASLLAVSGIAALTSLRSRRQRGLRATD